MSLVSVSNGLKMKGIHILARMHMQECPKDKHTFSELVDRYTKQISKNEYMRLSAEIVIQEYMKVARSNARKMAYECIYRAMRG